MATRLQNENERGAVLLTTLLVMTIMAGLAVALIDDVRFAVKRAVNVQSYAQSDWYAEAAEDFAQTYLASTLTEAPPAQVNTLLRTGAPIVLPIEGGNISLFVRDGSQCQSLGALGNAPAQRQFVQLLEILGWDNLTARQLVDSASDWADPDTQRMPNGAEDYTYLGLTPAYRTPNTQFSSVMELRAIAGMDEAKFQALRPFVCARGANASANLNVNTLSLAQAPLLAALLGGTDQYGIAEQIIRERPSEGYADLAALTEEGALQGVELKNANMAALSFEPEHVWIEADIFYLEARRTVVMEFAIEENGVRRTFKRYNTEARRPILEADPV